ncbi:MAG TPA: methylenetetrahydrofolate reductase [NAD(P)H] [Lachnospiraceae bacterium]|nr:methylenetetrahydrofolate reductase [NAD(P)H] [Lachnospiraceae bacterium]
MKITSLFEEKKPVLSFEIFPPKKESTLKNIEGTLDELSRLKPDFVSVTFGAGGTLANNATVQLAKKIKEQYKIEPLVHVTCLNYSKEEIDIVLKELKENSIENILALRGDRNPEMLPKDDFKYASDLIQYIKETSDFGLSGACYPEKHLESVSVADDLIHLKKKVDAGAKHLISQLFFDNDLFYSFYEKSQIVGINVPIEAGIIPVTNKKQIERMISMCGATLPSKFSKVLQKYEDNPEALMDAGIAYAVNQIVDLLAHDVAGIHIYTMNNPMIAKKICESIKNLI